MRLALREVWTAFRRAPGLGFLSVFTIAFSLFAFGLFGLVAYRRGALLSGAAIHLLALPQTLLIAQAALGLLLLSGNYRATDELHYVYGGVALGVVLSPWFYAPADPRRRLLWFAVSALVAAALGVRGTMTGA